MSYFATPLVLQDDGGLPFVLAGHLTYYSDLLNRWIVVPVGFKTDLASIPRLLWNVLPPFGRYDKAAVVHDFLYRTNGITRAQADAVFSEAMQVLGVNIVQRWIIYSAVRVGGGRIWDRYRRDDQPRS